MLSEPEEVIRRLSHVFDTLGVEYLVGGSIASSVHGIPRFTRDVDLVADIRDEHVDPLVAALGEEFYIDGDMIRSSIVTASSFNVIHLPTMVKADIFLRQSTPWSESEWARRRPRHIIPDDEGQPINVASAEDMILQKLEWYRLTGERSDRQWGDVQGMLKVQGEALDYAYLRRWATELGLSDLLNKAFADAGAADHS